MVSWWLKNRPNRMINGKTVTITAANFLDGELDPKDVTWTVATPDLIQSVPTEGTLLTEVTALNNGFGFLFVNDKLLPIMIGETSEDFQALNQRAASYIEHGSNETGTGTGSW